MVNRQPLPFGASKVVKQKSLLPFLSFFLSFFLFLVMGVLGDGKAVTQSITETVVEADASAMTAKVVTAVKNGGSIRFLLKIDTFLS